MSTNLVWRDEHTRLLRELEQRFRDGGIYEHPKQLVALVLLQTLSKYRSIVVSEEELARQVLKRNPRAKNRLLQSKEARAQSSLQLDKDNSAEQLLERVANSVIHRLAANALDI